MVLLVAALVALTVAPPTSTTLPLLMVVQRSDSVPAVGAAQAKGWPLGSAFLIVASLARAAAGAQPCLVAATNATRAQSRRADRLLPARDAQLPREEVIAKQGPTHGHGDEEASEPATLALEIRSLSPGVDMPAAITDPGRLRLLT